MKIRGKYNPDVMFMNDLNCDESEGTNISIFEKDYLFGQHFEMPSNNGQKSLS